MNDEWGAFNALVDVIHPEIPAVSDHRDGSSAMRGPFDATNHSDLNGFKAEPQTPQASPGAASSFHSIETSSPMSTVSPFVDFVNGTVAKTTNATQSVNELLSPQPGAHLQPADHSTANVVQSSSVADSKGVPRSAVSLDAERWADNHLAYSLPQDNKKPNNAAAVTPAAAAGARDRLSGIIPDMHRYMDSEHSSVHTTESYILPAVSPDNAKSPNTAPLQATGGTRRPVLGVSQPTELTIINDDSKKENYLTTNELDILGHFQPRTSDADSFNKFTFSKSSADSNELFTMHSAMGSTSPPPQAGTRAATSSSGTTGGAEDSSGGELLSFYTTQSSQSPATPTYTTQFHGATTGAAVVGAAAQGSRGQQLDPTATAGAQGSRRHSASSVSSSSSVLSIFDLPRPPRGGPLVADINGEPTNARRPAARVAPDELEDAEKKMVYLLDITNEKITPVGWCADMAAEDVKEALLCGCDAMVDSGFRLREVIPVKPKHDALIPLDEDASMNGSALIEEVQQHVPVATATSQLMEPTGTPTHFAAHTSDKIEVTIDGQSRSYTCGQVYEFEQFHELIDSRTYILEKGVERTDLKGVIGDRSRRLRIEIDPLLHVEAQKALSKMHTGSNLLKHTRKGFPHLRQFQLCRDNRRLIWYSGSKGRTETTVGLDSVAEVKFGQTTTTFQKYLLPMLSHLSFSIIYQKNVGALRAKRTLDLTCKDEIEFDYWLTGIKAAICSSKGLGISKQRLLEHSRRFRKALVQNNISVKLSELPEVLPADAVSLAKCVDLPVHTKPDIERKIVRIAQRLSALKVKVKSIPPPPRPTTADLPAGVPNSTPATTATITPLAGAAVGSAAVGGAAVGGAAVGGAAVGGAAVGSAAVGSAAVGGAAVGGAAVAVQGTLQHSPPLASTGASPAATVGAVGEATSQSAATSWLSMWLKKSDSKSEQSAATQAVDDFEDDSMERLRMGELLQVVEGLIQTARDGVAEFELQQQALAPTPQPTEAMQNPPNAAALALTDANQQQTAKLKVLNQTLWKAEVDLENAEDMYRRIANPGMGSPLERTISELNQQFSEEFLRIGDQISHKFVSWFSPSSATTT